MKNRTNKNILQKIIIAILTVLLLSNIIMPTYSHADFGGVLMSPIVDLLCSVGDAVINILQKCMTGNFGSSDLDFSFNAFMVEDDEYFANQSQYTKNLNSNATVGHKETIDAGNDFDKGWLGTSNKYHIPVATYSPEQIFAGQVAGLDINFIQPNKYEGQNESSASKLQPTIATWYVALRNLTVVGLLSVLVYVGIRIIISSSASDKAKYKQMLTDWLVALCLVFFLHYIMSFVLTMTESICTAIAGNGATNIEITVDGGSNASGTFQTNLLGLARFKTQYKDFGQKMAYLIMYLALVIYTLIFTWFYLKRLLMMAFLTLIAPVVALTYPIDKMNDGKAQAFDSWLKEYVFNALIQPFHLIIYMVFVGSAMDLASTNIIYMIAALAFILPAEKILRKFFGFDKAGAGTLGALAGGLTAGSLLGRLGKGKGGSSGKASGSKAMPEGEKPPRFEKKHDVAQIEDGTTMDNINDNNEESNIPEEDNTPRFDLSEEEKAEKDELQNYFDNTSNEDAYMNPDEYQQKLARMQELEDKENQQNQNNTFNANNTPNNTQNEQRQQEEQQKANRMANWARAHNINGRSALRLGGRAITGVAKFGTRTAFKAGAGTLAAAVTLASGGGFAGASAAFAVGSSVGGRLGNTAINAGTALGHGVERLGRAALAQRGVAPAEQFDAAMDAMFGGTRLGQELDLANGNTRYQTAGEMRAFKNNQNNLNYVRDQIAAQNGGVVPSAREVKDKMNTLDPYMKEGLTDIKEMLKAQKAEQYGISSKQAAIIAAIGKEKGITADVLNDSKKANAQQANLQQEFMNKGYSKENAEKQADYTMNVLKVQNGVAHNLQKPQSTNTNPTRETKPPKTKK